jgi:lipopolysaccharide transport system permease protein
MQPLISAYQDIFLAKTVPDPYSLLPLAVFTVIFLLLGAHFFLTRSGELVDEL